MMNNGICYVHFSMDDLVGNLFITLKELGYDIDKISYHLIDIYSDILKANLKEVGIVPVFNLSRNHTNSFLDRNKHLYTDYNEEYIRLISDMSTDELIDLYRGYLSNKVVFTMCSNSVKEELQNAYNKLLEASVKIKTKTLE